MEALWESSCILGVDYQRASGGTLETLWESSWILGLIPRGTLETQTLWRHSDDTLASWTLDISTIVSGESPECLQIFGPLS